MDSTATQLAEEISMLKAANDRLTRQMRRLAEDVVQKETGHAGDDESVKTLDSEEDQGATKKLASEAMAEDIAILAEMAQEALTWVILTVWQKSWLLWTSWLRNTRDITNMVKQPQVLVIKTLILVLKIVRKESLSWDGYTKDFHNLNYYQKNRGNPELWGVKYDGPVGKYDRSKKAEFVAEDILSDAEFAEILAEMDSMAEESLAGGKGSGGNTKGTRKVINQYGEAAPGFGYQDPDTRAKNRAKGKKSEWDGYTKDFYNLNYYSANRGKIDGWPEPKNPRVAEMDEDHHMASEEEQMLKEMLAEMQAEMNMAEETDAGHPHMAEETDAGHHEAMMPMAEDSEAGHSMVSEDVMGLDMEGGEAGLDPKLARIFQAADEVASEDEASEEVVAEEASEDVATKKSASFRPQTQARQASVKTLGNISREASSSSDELSKLWESAPDVSKFFG